jgi:hypothetical protein
MRLITNSIVGSLLTGILALAPRDFIRARRRWGGGGHFGGWGGGHFGGSMAGRVLVGS